MSANENMIFQNYIDFYQQTSFQILAMVMIPLGTYLACRVVLRSRRNSKNQNSVVLEHNFALATTKVVMCFILGFCLAIFFNDFGFTGPLTIIAASIFFIVAALEAAKGIDDLWSNWTSIR